MKEFMKSRWFPLVATIICVAILAAFLFVNGFRITYAPELENSWDAISAVASWVGVVVSGLAIYYAVQVPKKIADRQDKIALFEKRFNCYMAVQRITTFAISIKDAKTAAEISNAFLVSFRYSSNYFDNADFANVISDFQLLESNIVVGEFLFPQFDTKMIQDLLRDTINFIVHLIRLNDTKSLDEEISDECLVIRDSIYNQAIKFRTTYMLPLEKEINLKNQTV